MALTWGTLVFGAVVVFGLPIAVILMNRRKRNAGWWLLAAFVALIIAGNVAEKIITGNSAIF
jgi:hypothetical protein